MEESTRTTSSTWAAYSIGWAAILPQMLAALGAVFALAGVGDIIGVGVGAAIPEGSVFLTVVVFALGMALCMAGVYAVI